MGDVINFRQARERLEQRAHRPTLEGPHPSKMPFFNPEQRHAILINSVDYNDGYSQEDLNYRGNRAIYGLEAVLTGTLSKIPQGPFRRKLLEYTFSERAFFKEMGKRDRYVSVTRIMPPHPEAREVRETCTILGFPQPEMKQRLGQACRRIAFQATNKTLTLVYLISTGEDGCFFLGDKAMSYEELVSHLDRIDGKKVIAALASHSGWLVDAIGESSRREDYLLIAVAKKEEKTNELVDSRIQEQLETAIMNREPLSSLSLNNPAFATLICTPMVSGYFDATL